MWPADFRRPLPALCVPLAAPDPDVMLDLQPLVDAVYARSRYDRDIDYRRPLRPPLSPSDTIWLECSWRNATSRSNCLVGGGSRRRSSRSIVATSSGAWFVARDGSRTSSP